MPTVSLNITTGLEYSPTDLVDSSVKLHNFIVGQDGSLYKIPALKNLKTLVVPAYGDTVSDTDPVFLPERLLDIKKYQTSQKFTVIPTPAGASKKEIFTYTSFRKICFLGLYYFGSINVNYAGEIQTDVIADDEPFTRIHFNPESSALPEIDINSFSEKILFDFNAQFQKELKPIERLRVVFPSQHYFQGGGTTPEFSGPRNMVSAVMDPLPANPEVSPLIINKNDKEEYNINDLAKGAISIGNRMVFYSEKKNGIIISDSNDFSSIKPDNNDPKEPYIIHPPSQIHSIIEFNGNIVTFTPTGMERWVISPDEELILQQDPTFHFDYRGRYNGSFVRANKDLYFYTDDLRSYRLNTDFTVDNIFKGQLPVYKPLDSFLIPGDYLERHYICSYFKMLGQKFVSFGAWLYNIDTETWSTYNYDGWKNPTLDPVKDSKPWIWKDDTAKQTVATAYDDVICTYNAITKPLTYEEMQDASFDDDKPSLVEGKHQWGEVAFFTSRMYQDERTFSLDGIEIYVRGGMLQQGVSKMWLKVLLGGEKGDFDINDPLTWGQESTYQVLPNSKLGELEVTHVGKFVWRTNIKTDRFRVQVVTNEKRGIVVQSVLANITQISDSQDYLVNRSNPQQQTKK